MPLPRHNHWTTPQPSKNPCNKTHNPPKPQPTAHNPHTTTATTTQLSRHHLQDRLAARKNKKKYSCISAGWKERGRKSVACMIEEREREREREIQLYWGENGQIPPFSEICSKKALFQNKMEIYHFLCTRAH